MSMAEPDVKAVLTAITDLQNKDALDASLTMGPFALAIQKWEELSRRFMPTYIRGSSVRGSNHRSIGY